MFWVVKSRFDITFVVGFWEELKAERRLIIRENISENCLNSVQVHQGAEFHGLKLLSDRVCPFIIILFWLKMNIK